MTTPNNPPTRSAANAHEGQTAADTNHHEKPEQEVPDKNPAKAAWPMFQRKGGIQFSSGEIMATTNAINEISGDDIARGLSRHLCGDWGEVCPEDWKLNDEALEVGNRLLSAYTAANGVKFWIITEWDRSVTTILLPDDY
jgi:hypothetical protein